MVETLLNKYGINQIGIVVDDLEEAIVAHNKIFGSGPFFLTPPIVQEECNYRGENHPVTMECAYGAFHGIQIEFIKVTSEGPSVYAEKKGFNHFSIWVDDREEIIAAMKELGIEPAMTFTSGGGLDVVYFDTLERYGHFIECHKPQPFLVDLCLKAAEDWDGTDLIRTLGR